MFVPLHNSICFHSNCFPAKEGGKKRNALMNWQFLDLTQIQRHRFTFHERNKAIKSNRLLSCSVSTLNNKCIHPVSIMLHPTKKKHRRIILVKPSSVELFRYVTTCIWKRPSPFRLFWRYNPPDVGLPVSLNGPFTIFFFMDDCDHTVCVYTRNGRGMLKCSWFLEFLK